MKEREEKKTRATEVGTGMPGTFLQNRIKVGLANIRCNKNNLTRPNLKKGRLKSIPEEGYVTDLVLIFEGNIFLLPSCYFYV